MFPITTFYSDYMSLVYVFQIVLELFCPLVAKGIDCYVKPCNASVSKSCCYFHSLLCVNHHFLSLTVSSCALVGVRACVCVHIR